MPGVFEDRYLWDLGKHSESVTVYEDNVWNIGFSAFREHD